MPATQASSVEREMFISSPESRIHLDVLHKILQVEAANKIGHHHLVDERLAACVLAQVAAIVKMGQKKKG